MREMSEKQLLEYLWNTSSVGLQNGEKSSSRSLRREKLIALIQEAVGGCAYYWAARIADHLAENGVYVKEAGDNEH